MSDEKAKVAPPKMKLAATANDLKIEAEGTWVDVPVWPGVRFLVRGAGYPPFQTALRMVRAKLFRKYPGKKTVPAEVEDVENGKLYAQYLLLGWDGFDVEYAPDVAEEKLTDPAMRHLRAQVMWAASEVGEPDIEDALGNSNGGSAGGSAGAAKPAGSSA